MFPCRLGFTRGGGSGQSWRLVLGHLRDVSLCVILTRATERVFLYMGRKQGAAQRGARIVDGASFCREAEGLGLVPSPMDSGKT
jgi:hypothetical protein